MTQGFGLGFYDGITGLVTQPLEGAKREGFSGLAKGFGKGIGGLVFKPGAGNTSPIDLRNIAYLEKLSGACRDILSKVSGRNYKNISEQVCKITSLRLV